MKIQNQSVRLNRKTAFTFKKTNRQQAEVSGTTATLTPTTFTTSTTI